MKLHMKFVNIFQRKCLQTHFDSTVCSNMIYIKAKATSAYCAWGNSQKSGLISMRNAVSEYENNNTGVFQKQCSQTLFDVTTCSDMIYMKANALSSHFVWGNSVDKIFGKSGLFKASNAVSEHENSNTKVFKRQC